MTSAPLPALELCYLIMDKLVQLSALRSPQSMCPLGLYSQSRGVEESGHRTSIVTSPEISGEGLVLSSLGGQYKVHLLGGRVVFFAFQSFFLLTAHFPYKDCPSSHIIKRLG